MEKSTEFCKKIFLHAQLKPGFGVFYIARIFVLKLLESGTTLYLYICIKRERPYRSLS